MAPNLGKILRQPGKMQPFWQALYSAGHKPLDSQIERLIALLRVALVGFSFAAFIVTPIPSTQLDFATVTLLGAYTLFGLVILAISFHRRSGWQLPAHLLDLGFISMLVSLLANVSSVFFILYTFVLLAATQRWNWQGALWSTALLLTLHLTLTLPTRELVQIDGNTAASFYSELFHDSCLVVLGGMFTFLGASRERSQNRLAQLAWSAPPTNIPASVQAHSIQPLLLRMAAVMEAPRVLLFWEQSEEPHLHIAYVANGQVTLEQKPADAFGDLVAPKFTSIVFTSDDIKSNRIVTVDGESERCELPPINPSICTQFNIHSVATAPFSGAICKGRLFILDRSSWNEEDFMLTEIVASRMAVELEHLTLRLQVEQTAMARERMRIARDLHDGVLQTLTAAGLQLKAIASSPAGSARHNIEETRQLLLDEQHRIRVFVQNWRNSVVHRDVVLYPAMHELIDKIGRQWNCACSLSVTPKDATIPLALGRHLDFILSEAIANAVQHGGASRLDVTVEKSDCHAVLRIKDNGSGLKGVSGVYSPSELADLDLGPVSLRHRIAEISGVLGLSSSCGGVELYIELPLPN